MKKSNSPRRKFLKQTLLGSAFLGLTGRSLAREQNRLRDRLEKILEPRPARGKSVIDLTVPPIKQVKVGIIGIGSRGFGHVKQFNALFPEKAKITAICDIREERVNLAVDWLKENKGQKPATYSGTEDAWKEMVKRDDIDLVIVVTPWNDHAPMCVYTMQQGKHVATEVPAAVTLDECWDLVNTSEETQRNCMMMENVCYGAEELWILNMVQEGVFGTLTYGEAAYIHNLRQSLFTGYYDYWRMKANIASDGNLYPTHGLGPVAQYMDILRGDTFDRLVSMSTLEASLSEEAMTVPQDNPFYGRKEFAHGDMNNTLVKTALGRTILVQHDVVTPRPYSRINALGGTKAYHEGYPSRLSVHGKGHEWLSKEDYTQYREQYQHPIWNRLKEAIAKNGGHGGMDFVMVYRLVDCFNRGIPLDMDVYDGAAWSGITPLSKLSVEMGNIPVRFPDFTRGKWKDERKLGMLKYQ